MTKKPSISIHDIESGEVIIREMTDSELAQHQLDLAEWSAGEQSRIAKEATRIAVLSKLGLTAEEAAALLS
jgi:hypothetical protein